ncbi:hypothetical protein PPO43_12205 [Saprospira sp. CCB-QB6]|uniref:hypothetical protein n=1 Tax=Saprospira sp. CCB-QB6 TaxID=3023936 RepID=UPI00234A8B9B|nr:hypothetical protein [Saprospira sp. CCB-QB6]WCL80732.1 hypothetical protein PPO43_12205 [Saprospira sp. CCB-QB6]
MQLFKDRLPYGLIWGLLTPILSFALLYAINKSLLQSGIMDTYSTAWPGFKDSTLSLIAICGNLIPVAIANRRRLDEFTRGIMLPTVILAFVWMFYYNPLGI